MVIWRGCTSLTSLPEGLSVGGGLDLRGCTSLTSLPEGLSVGGSLYLNGCTRVEKIPESAIVQGAIEGDIKFNAKRLKEGEYIEGRCILADGILTAVVRKRELMGYTWYEGKNKERNVISDGEYFAHCGSFSEGVRDLQFKKQEERGAEQYRELTAESEVSAEEAAAMYRIITGACQRGTEDFIASLDRVKEKYTIAEIIEMTKDQYGGRAFAEFFGERE